MKMKANTNRLSVVINITIAVAVVFFMATLFTCTLFNLGDAVGYVPAYSQLVGPEGGTVTDGRGASVVIPEGALAEETTITIASYQNAADVFKNHGVTPFPGGAAFGPAGTEFLKPVTITLPTASMCPAGQEQALFLYNTSTGSWDQPDTGCTANEGGATVSAEVTHFSSYVTSLFPPGAMSMFASFFEGSDGAVALSSYANWFLRTSGIYGYKTECGEATHEVIGVHFSVTYQVDGASGSEAYVHGGSSDDTHTSISYQHDYTSSAGKEINYDLLITLHWKVTEEEPEREMFVSLTEPVAGATVEGLQNISTFTVGGSEIIEKVEFFVDGTSVGSDTEAPYGITWDAGGYAAGEHTVKATATSTGGETADSEEVAVSIGEVEPEAGIGSWTASTAFTTGRLLHTSVVHNGYVYVIGGHDGSNHLNDVQYAKINADGTIGTWNSTTSFTTERHRHTSVVHDGYVYVIGGLIGTNYLNDVQYAKINQDGTIGAWNNTTSFVTERGYHTSIVYNGYIYVLGGSSWDVDHYIYFDGVQYAKINADGTVGAWNSTTPFTGVRHVHTSVVHNGYVYVIGGLDDGSNHLNDVQYAKINADGTIGAWNTATPFITARGAHTSIVHNGYLYVIGGYDGSNYLNDVQYAEINANGTLGPWNSTTPFITARGAHTSVVHNGYVYVLGGIDYGSNHLNDVQYTSFLE